MNAEVLKANCFCGFLLKKPNNDTILALFCDWHARGLLHRDHSYLLRYVAAKFTFCSKNICFCIKKLFKA